MLSRVENEKSFITSGPGMLFFQLTSWFTLQTSDYDLIINFRVDSMSFTKSIKKCIIIMT